MADHQNKPDLAALPVKQWFDEAGVAMIQDRGDSSRALMITSITRAKNQVFLSTRTATSDLTGKCDPLGDGHVHGVEINLGRDDQTRW